MRIRKRNSFSQMFESALKEASIDLSKEMGYSRKRKNKKKERKHE